MIFENQQSLCLVALIKHHHSRNKLLMKYNTDQVYKNVFLIFAFLKSKIYANIYQTCIKL